MRVSLQKRRCSHVSTQTSVFGFFQYGMYHDSLQILTSNLSSMFHRGIWSRYFSRECIMYLFSFTDSQSENDGFNEGFADHADCSGARAGDTAGSIYREARTVEREFIIPTTLIDKSFDLVTYGIL
ncbi:b6.1 [Ichnoviriform fugitivi]|uniref:B6.1 n=1 Tax=Ichnoviriform fugitivi TaxID=265522 RepID=A2Q0E1_9VIRU|nr:b6.1 [Ichnoviriform fugitivi]BAF45656.1 b6.1 [Ichnoviriform fugitivi]